LKEEPEEAAGTYSGASSSSAWSSRSISPASPGGAALAHVLAVDRGDLEAAAVLPGPTSNLDALPAGFAEESGACVGTLPVLNALDLCGQIFKAEVWQEG